MKNKYKLIATDFDGTLLDSNNKISKRTLDVFELYHQNGYIIVGLTGRTFKSLIRHIDLNIFDYIIFNNGACIYNPQSKEIKIVKEIKRNDAENILDTYYDSYNEIDFVSVNNYYIYKEKIMTNLDFLTNIDDLKEVKESILKINIYFNDIDNLNYYCKEIMDNFKDLNAFIMQDSFNSAKWVVLTPKGINKLETLKEFGKEKGINLDEMIFFGDGLNDVEAIANVGLGVAMGNALEEVKRCAKAVTKTNNEEGIAEFLENLK